MSKPTPKFWWDFVDNATAVIVESNYPGGEELARFEVPKGNGAEQQIRAAEQLIADYQSGCKTPAWRQSV